jgi:hypothetical protein
MSSCHYAVVIASEGQHLRNVGVNFEENFGLGFGLHFEPTFFKENKTGKTDILLVPRTS